MTDESSINRHHIVISLGGNINKEIKENQIIDFFQGSSRNFANYFMTSFQGADVACLNEETAKHLYDAWMDKFPKFKEHVQKSKGK